MPKDSGLYAQIVQCYENPSGDKSQWEILLPRQDSRTFACLS